MHSIHPLSPLPRHFAAGVMVAALLAVAGTAAADKLVVPKGFSPGAIAGAELIADYGSYRLVQVPASAAADALQAHSDQGVRRLQRPDWLLFEQQPFNTQQNPPQLKAPASGAGLHLVQFVGPVKQAWLDSVQAAGATPVHYVANNGYLVWADAATRANLDALAANGEFLQFSAPYDTRFKPGSLLRDKMDTKGVGDQVVPVTVQIFRHDGAAATRDLVASLARERLGDWTSILAYQNGRFEIALADLPAILARPDVYRVEQIVPRELLDEVQDQIMAGNFDASMSGPDAPGYLSFLNAKGFSTNPGDYPVVDIVDDGIGNGTVDSGDPTLHQQGDAANPTRLSFVSNCTGASSGEGIGGHGHINTSIVGGFDDRAGFPFEDPDLFQRGMGVNPFGPIAGTRVFAPGFDLSACGGTDLGLIEHTWEQGARISTNSWGASVGGDYNASSQAFDAGTRDADPDAAGNQQLMHIFAAGNSGSGSSTVGSPATGKNVLSVGASENDRPSDEDGDWTDGCAVGPTGADNAMDVIGFSSRGPAEGDRVKPETIAPGTHIQGTASTNAGFDGSSVCDQFRPSGQTTFAASSGTSHSTPAVAGLASLTWWWLENATGILPATAGNLPQGFGTPTPALIKAYIMAHPTHLTGVSANDTLPSNVQGYGMPNMSIMFDDTIKHVVNQEVVFDNSGETWEFVGSAADPSKPVRIMLAYTDEPGPTGAAPQVNDLNLSVETGGDTYLGNVFNGRWSVTGGSADANNNYEAVFLEPGTASGLTITVEAFNIAGDGVPNSGDGTDQDFALVCYNCAQDPTFTLNADPAAQSVCTPADADYQVDVGSILGFADDVTLSATGNPSGTTTSFSTNPVTPAEPPNSSTLTIGDTGSAAFGTSTITVEGTTGAETKSTDVTLSLFTQAPAAPTLSAPADGATDVDLLPTLEWANSPQGEGYFVEVATDPAFSNIVYSSAAGGGSHTVGTALEPVTQYYWRVRGDNICGTGNFSSAFTFTTRPIPPVLLVDDDDNTPDVRAALTDTLNGMGVGFDVFDTGNSDNEPDFAGLAPYDRVIWFTGDEFGGAAGPGSDGEAALADYLDNAGGCLLVSSQDYFFDRGLTTFMQDHLGVADATNDQTHSMALGASDSMFEGLGPYTLDYAGAGFTNFSDTLTIGNGAAAFTGDGDVPIASVGAAGNAAWLAFSLPALTDVANRQDLMQAFFDNACISEVVLSDGFEDPAR